MYALEAQDAFAATAAKTSSELELFKNKVECWFNTSMDRVGGTLKRRYSRPFTFFLSLIIVAALNADSISIARYLYNNPEARIKLAEEAFDVSMNEDFQRQVESLKNIKGVKVNDSTTLDQLADSIKLKIATIEKTKAAMADAIPLGWQENELKKEGKISYALILMKVAGLFASVLAVMMGAPFWFDVLNKISNLRGVGKKPETSNAKEETT